VFILKGVKVLCFDTLLQVLILKVVRALLVNRIQTGLREKEGRSGDTVSRTLTKRYRIAPCLSSDKLRAVD
jgi:hypothetical protein